MVLSIIASPRFIVTQILLPTEIKSSSLAIWNSSFPRQTHCRVLCMVANDSQTIPRRSAKYKPSIWTNDYIMSLRSEYKEEKYAEQGRALKEEVRMMLYNVDNELHQLEFIDALQRLGVYYHFNKEIRNVLNNVYNKETYKEENNLYAKALMFRLLRQHGYNISAGKFKKCHCVDVEGILSLYEASFYSFKDETILNEARDFTSKFLKGYLNLNKGDHISLLISHALEFPLHWIIPRWEARWYIDAYERKQNKSPVLLQFAKLDFNIVQSIYQEELKDMCRWWNRSGLGEKLNFARNRLVENFIWTVGTNFQPDLQYARKMTTKVNSFITIIDDVYDTYGTLEELEIFTEVIASWDLNAMDNLPDYMKICFFALYNFVNEMAFDCLKETGYYITPYLKKAWTDLCKSYLIEAKWYRDGYIPSLKEYIENAWVSIGAPVILTHGYFLTPHSYNMEDLVYLEQNTNLIRLSALILRFANDLGTYKRENDTGDNLKSIQCYMHETGASEVEAQQHLRSLMSTVWKEMNKEAHSSTFYPSFIDASINLGRMALCMYQHGDGHTIQDSQIKNFILSLIFQPILKSTNL